MNQFGFAPIVDLPLVAVVTALFIWHFNHWAYRTDLETNVDVAVRLPAARLRVIALFAALLLLCWFFNFAVWSIFAILFAIGLAIALFTGGDVDGGVSGFLAAAYLIREWSFGFPELILHPPNDQNRSTIVDPTHELVGRTGTTLSPLRPTGDAIIDDAKVSVASDDGCLIDAGTDVIVTSYRNGRLCVRPQVNAEDSGLPGTTS